MRRRTLGLGALLALTACAPRVVLPARTPPLRLAGPPPDVLIISVSGHCAPLCEAPYANGDDMSSRGTVDVIADAVAAAGYRVQVAGYASGAFNTLESQWVFPPQRGWVALQNDFAQMRQRWPELGRRPRIVMLGHSQGAPWLHHLARLNPDIPFALQIDIDSICMAWQTDHRRFFDKLTPQQAGNPSIATACDTISIGGRLYRGKNIVWPNVERNLEIQSKRLYAPVTEAGGEAVNLLWSVTHNIRPDGSHTGITTVLSRREDHSILSHPQSQAMRWAAGQARLLALEWKKEDAAASP